MNASELGVASPSLPAYLLYPVAGLSAILILWAMARARHRAGAFVIGSAWLRYIMQALAPLYLDELAEPVRVARLCQTKLGDIHDCDVWIDTLPCFLEEEQARTLEYFGSTTPFEPLRPGLLALLHNRQQQRAQDYQEFVTFWEQLQAQRVWERLRQTLDAAGVAGETSDEQATAALAGNGTAVPTS